jgi:hypothetical protein
MVNILQLLPVVFVLQVSKQVRPLVLVHDVVDRLHLALILLVVNLLFDHLVIFHNSHRLLPFIPLQLVLEMALKFGALDVLPVKLDDRVEKATDLTPQQLLEILVMGHLLHIALLWDQPLFL